MGSLLQIIRQTQDGVFFCHNILFDSILNIVNRSLLSLKAYAMQRVHNCTI